MERKSWIWGKMMYGKTQLFDSTPSLKAAAPGKQNHSCDLHSSRGRRCWPCSGRTLPLLDVPCRGRGTWGSTGGTGPPGAEPAGQQPGKVPAQGTRPTSSFISQPGHCLCHTLSLLEQQIIVPNFS